MYTISFVSCRKRDAACLKLKKMYEEAMNERRAAGRRKDDMLQTLMESTYKYDEHCRLMVNKIGVGAGLT